MSEGVEPQAPHDTLDNAPLLDGMVAAAHELKTPLTIINHLAASLSDKTYGLTPSEQKIAVERIQLSAQRTLALVEGLTVAHRLETDQQLAFRFRLEPLNATQLCEEIAHEMLPFARAHGQGIQLHAGRTKLVVGNRELLRSVFFNLIDNAIKHNPPETAVGVHVKRRTDTVRICVRDNGPGLPGQDMHSVRRTLGRELQPLHSRSGSSGLGLYIAGSMAQAMGGRLGIGRLAKGADFHIDLLYSKQMSFL